MKLHRTLAFAGVSLLALSSVPAFAADAQPSPDAGASAGSGEIVVQARRRDERLQDVPKVISVVTAAQLDKLNIRQFSDVQSTAPGLTLQDAGNGYTQKTTMRGVSFDVNAGADATVDFYLNDSSIHQSYLFRTLYDIGQIEVLRGPQGTLRGRATPSGSITFTTKQPDLYKVGGYVDGTTIGSSIGGNNIQGAVNVPIIEGKLAVRVAAQFDDNDGTGVRPAHTAQQGALTAEPYSRTWSERVSVRFEPTETLQFNVMYQRMNQRFLSYEQTASICVLTGTTCPTGFTVINPSDRQSTENGNTQFREQFDIINGRADWHVLGQKLSYVGSYAVGTFDAYAPMDKAAVFGAFGPGITQYTHSRNQYQSHEVRLASEQRIAGLFDYTVGIFNITSPTQNVVNYAGSTIVYNNGNRRETSVFGNVTAHPTDKLEISAGLRKIIASGNTSNTISSGLSNPTSSLRWLPTIWTASASYHFTPAIMAYVSAGTSSRQGTNSVGPVLTPLAYGVSNATIASSAVMQYANLKSEYSHSYEVGVKTQFNQRHGTFNLSYFHQDFSNFQFANAGNVNVFDSTLGGAGVPGGIPVSGMGANVPVKIDGVEGSLGYNFSRNLNAGVDFSYVKSRITGGQVPCNSGTPTSDGSVQLCTGSGPASYAPPFTATVHGEYSRPINDSMTGFLRGQLSIYGATQYNPDVPLNKQDAYALLNAYVGVRAPNDAWTLSFFVKNLTDTRTVLASYGGNMATTTTTSGGTVTSPYATIGYTPPRQFGVNLRVSFGSK